MAESWHPLLDRYDTLLEGVMQEGECFSSLGSACTCLYNLCWYHMKCKMVSCGASGLRLPEIVSFVKAGWVCTLLVQCDALLEGILWEGTCLCCEESSCGSAHSTNVAFHKSNSAITGDIHSVSVQSDFTDPCRRPQC